MAEVSHPQYPNAKIDIDSAVADPDQDGFFNYTANINGGFVKLNSIEIDPSNISSILQDSDSNGYNIIASTLEDAGAGSNPQEMRNQDDIIGKTVGPAAQKTAANFLGIIPDLVDTALYGVDVLPNLVQYGLDGFEGDFPSKRYLSSGPKKVFGGSESIARGAEAFSEAVSTPARESVTDARSSLEEAAGPIGGDPSDPESMDFGNVLKRASLRTLSDALAVPETILQTFEFDMTPDESDTFRKNLSLGVQVTVGAPLDGVGAVRLAARLATSGLNLTRKYIAEAMGAVWKNPGSAAAIETGYGLTAAGGMIGSMEALEEFYPNSPEFVKQFVAAGGGMAAPMLTATVGPSILAAFKKDGIPVLNIPAKLGSKFMSLFSPEGIQNEAAKLLQATGTDRNIADVAKHLLMGQLAGRTMDADTRAAYTLPQMARNEARILQAEIQLNKNNLKPSELKVKQDYLNQLNIWARFQEKQLATIFGSPEGASEILVAHSGRVLDRADSIKNSLAEVLKIKLGGEESPPLRDPISNERDLSVEMDWSNSIGGQYRFTENRKRALMEGKPLAMSENVSKNLAQALEDNLNKFEDAVFNSKYDAETMVEKIRNSIPEDADAGQRDAFNFMIKKVLEGSRLEMSNLESIIWANIGGMDTPKTREEFVTNSAGEKESTGPALMFGDKTVAQYFADKLRNLGAGELEHQSKYLPKLAGRSAIVDKEIELNPNSNDVKVVLRNRETIADLQAANEKLDRSRLPGYRGKPLSLLEFLSKKGGLRGNEKVPDAGGGDLPTEGSFKDIGELFGQDADKWHQGKRFKKLVLDINSNRTTERERWQEAMTLDQALTAVRQEGYQLKPNEFDTGSNKNAPETIDINDLTTAIKEELDGNKIYRADDEDAITLRNQEIEAAENNIRFLDELGDQLGIDARGINPETNRVYTTEEILDLKRNVESQAEPVPANLDDIIRVTEELRLAENRIIKKDTAGIRDNSNNDNLTDSADDGTVTDTGELGVIKRGGLLIGRTGKEVQQIRSNVLTEYDKQASKPGGRGRNIKLQAIGSLLKDLDQILIENFPNIDKRIYDSAKRVSAAKGEIYQRGGIGGTFDTTRGGDLKIDVRSLEAAILPQGKGKTSPDPQNQLIALKQLQNALTKLDKNDPGGLFKEDADGNFSYNSDGADLDFFQNNPPRPFVQETVDRRARTLEETVDPTGVPVTKLGLKVAEGTPVSPENIDVVQGILWRRFQRVTLDGNNKFDPNSAQKFIDENQPAIKWLDKALEGDSGFQSLTSAEAKVRALSNLEVKNLDKVIESLKLQKVFDDPDVFSEADFRKFVAEDITKRKNLNAAGVFLENDPMGAARKFVDNFLSKEKIKNPDQSLNEITKVFESAQLKDGSNSAFEGFRSAISEDIFKRFLSGREDGTPTGKYVEQISKDTGENVKIIDGNKILQFLKNDRANLLLQKLYGSHAPDLFKTFARSALEQNPLPAGTTGSPMAGSKVSNELIGTLGRLAGLYAASKAAFVNSLVMAGVGRRVAVGVADELKGKGILRHLAAGLLDIKYGLALMKELPDLTAADKALIASNFKKFSAADRLNKRSQRLGGFPGALLSTGDAAQEMPLDLEEQEVSAIPRPSRAPQVAALNLRPPQQGSLLDKVSPVLQGGSPMGTGSGPTAQGTADRGRSAFGAMDPVFANKGGLVSLCGPGKPRQMVS